MLAQQCLEFVSYWTLTFEIMSILLPFVVCSRGETGVTTNWYWLEIPREC